MDAVSIILRKSFIAPLIKIRAAASHKGQHGHAMLLAGSKGRMGAAVIASRACLRAGAGLLTVNVPEDERSILQTAIPEAMLIMRNDEIDYSKYNAVGIGPALGVDDEAAVLLKHLLQQSRAPLLLDADVLSILSIHKELWPLVSQGTIITPHPGEFDRMFGTHSSIEERNAKAVAISLLHPWVIVLKGQHTQIAWEGSVFANSTGNAGLAKGGSGDALSGIIVSLLAQGYTPVNAANIGVYLHGLAADIAVKKQSVESLLVTDVVECIGAAFNETRS